MKMELLGEHSKGNDNNFFKLIEEAQEDWKEKYEHMKTKGKKQKHLLQEQIQKDLDVMQAKIDQEAEDKVRLTKLLGLENSKIEERSQQVKYLMGQLQSLQDSLLLENKIFTEKLDKLKKDRESTAT